LNPNNKREKTARREIRYDTSKNTIDNQLYTKLFAFLLALKWNVKQKFDTFRKTEWVYDPKPIFDHVRNYAIAGALAIAGIHIHVKFPITEQKGYAIYLLVLAFVLLILGFWEQWNGKSG
jgi:hypothetical protein